ncbi:type-1 angiotensin II receptor-associated protein isoform X3 [Anser cygnoides]|uniref:type-1 angiotensin II receptor-associated protein isoform X3 n=1 Tax=Anser cygnoides TaxID=8845 RepID=UPI0034D341A1
MDFSRPVMWIASHSGKWLIFGADKFQLLYNSQSTGRLKGHHSGTLAAYSVFLTGLLLTVLTDIIHVCVFYPSNDYLTDVKRFSIGMAIFSLLLKPASCYFVYQMYRERGGEYAFNIDLESSSDSNFAHYGLTRAGQDRSTYEPIDQQDASPQWPDPSKAAPHPY